MDDMELNHDAPPSVLFVDDDEQVLRALSLTLKNSDLELSFARERGRWVLTDVLQSGNAR